MPAGLRRGLQFAPMTSIWAACRVMAPQFEAAARELEPRVRLVKLNTEEAPSLSAAMNIRSIPTLALFAGGREIARQPGAMGSADIVRWARAHLPR